jgi:hypothetical protein
MCTIYILNLILFLVTNVKLRPQQLRGDVFVIEC